MLFIDGLTESRPEYKNAVSHTKKSQGCSGVRDASRSWPELEEEETEGLVPVCSYGSELKVDPQYTSSGRKRARIDASHAAGMRGKGSRSRPDCQIQASKLLQ